MKTARGGFYRRYAKRLLDVFCALIAMLLFCWLYAILAVLVRVRLGSPVIFRQPRPGKDERIFMLYKFRTMTDARVESGALLPDALRLSRFGNLLRSTSLDELPELWNILRGDMSIVGPRPLLVKYLPYYTQTERRRHAVRPGLTGLAQVNGRNALRWEDRFAYDVDYVDHISFALDAKIVLMTVGKVLSRSDVAEDTAASEGNLEEIRRKEMTVEG